MDATRGKALISRVGIGRPGYFPCPVNKLIVYSSRKYHLEDQSHCEDLHNILLKDSRDLKGIKDHIKINYGIEDEFKIEESKEYLIYDFSELLNKNIKHIGFFPLIYVEYISKELS